MTMTESTSVAYGHPTTHWPVGSTGTSISGNAILFGQRSRPRNEWLRAAAERLTDLFQLDSGWDGGSAPRIDPRCIERSLDLAKQIVELIPSLQMPLIMPTVNGGIVLEWTRDGAELSLEFNDEIRVFYDIPAHGIPWEGSFSDSPVNPGELLYEHFA